MITVNGVEVADRTAAVRELLRQRAVVLGLIAASASEAGDDILERLLDLEVSTPDPTEEECRRFYQARRQQRRCR